MSIKKVYFRETTFQQRKCLFELIEETGNVSKACKRMKISRGTYYYWKERYEKDGIEGIREPKSHSPHNHYTIDPLIEKRIVNLKRQHPNWGKKRIAQWIWKENNWEKIVAVNTVKNVLDRHGMWNADIKKKKMKNKGTTADKPNKTINIDLCFIPAEEMHEIDFSPFFQLLDEFSEKFSDVAGKCDNKATSGLDIFSQEEKKYDEKMNDYVLMRKSKQDRAEVNQKSNILAIEEKANLKQREEELRTRRRRIRIERKKENEEWKKYRDDRIKLKKKNC